MDHEQGSGAIGLAWDLDGNDLKLAASVICSQVVPGDVSLRRGHRRWLSVGHYVSDGSSAYSVAPGRLSEPDLHHAYSV
jgi:hypothetical protein